MDKQIRVAIILMIVGVCIPLMTLPFVSGYEKDKGLWKNFLDVGIKIKKDMPQKTQEISGSNAGDQKKGLIKKVPERIPFRLFLVPTFILIYIGIIKIDRARSKKR